MMMQFRNRACRDDRPAPAERKRVRPAVPESYEMLFHHAEYPRFWLEVEKHAEVAFNLRCARLERAIGTQRGMGSGRSRGNFSYRVVMP